MPPAELGRLTRLSSIREIGPHERYDFSAWLLENADALADVLEIELELDRAEESVGDFSLDLIGRDLTNGSVLMVENQLEPTDHWHLGQVLLYAAGTGAGTIVWIAHRFRPEHRQALNWLNENTGDGFHFFGVEVEVVKIGDSPPAPLLSLAVQPSDWQKKTRKKADASALIGKARLYADFWEQFIVRVRKEHPGWTRRGTGVRSENWRDFPSGISGSYIAASFARGARLRHELYIDSGDEDRNLELLRVSRLSERSSRVLTAGRWSSRSYLIAARPESRSIWSRPMYLTSIATMSSSTGFSMREPDSGALWKPSI